MSAQSYHFRRMYERWKERKHANDPKKVIRLAVVGARSSGKSFFLNDIIDALKSKGGAYYPLYRTEFRYREFSDYERNQTQTPVYVCRHDNHFGQTVHLDGKIFELDFLNIPGEIFRTKDEIQHYLNLRNALDVSRKLFTVTTYINEASDEEILIVEVKRNSTISDSDRNNTSSVMSSNTQFLEWRDIFGSLNAKGFKPLEGSKRSISGRTFLEYFFEYHTDSSIQSLADLLKTNQIQIDNVDATSFVNAGINRAFIFFQYCALATDIVICDRMFVKVVDSSKNMNFGTMVDQLASFLYNNKRRKPNVYLALRNVDFLLKQKEMNYKNLVSSLKDMSKEGKRNAIYSIFYYAMLHHLSPSNNKYIIPNDQFNYKIGLPKEIAIIDKDIARIVSDYLDLTFNGGIVNNATNNLQDHVTSRIGGSGMAFRRILGQTGWSEPANQHAIIPHVYFTCTPITEDFDIYENKIAQQGGDPYKPNEFYRNGIKDEFSERCSCACFGSFQLLMDILVQHGIINNPPMGQLLRELQANNK